MVATVGKRTRQLAWDEHLSPDGKARLPHAIDDFGGFGGDPEPYKLAPDLARIMVALIAKHPNRLGHLRQFALLILWAVTLGTVRGGLKWWAVEIPRRLFRWVLGQHEQPDFASAQAIVVISLAACKEAELTWWELEALVYAVLRTIEVNDEGLPRLVPMNELLEAEVAAQYGEWTPRLKRLMEALTDGETYQHRMDLEAEQRQAEAVKSAVDQVKAELRESLAGVLA